jgi:hypothetical protein
MFDKKNWWYYGNGMYSKEMAELKAKPVQTYKVDVAHTIGFRRIFPGLFDDHTTFQYINNSVYDDYFSQKPSETKLIISKYKADPQNYRLRMTELHPWC